MGQGPDSLPGHRGPAKSLCTTLTTSSVGVLSIDRLLISTQPTLRPHLQQGRLPLPSAFTAREARLLWDWALLRG